MIIGINLIHCIAVSNQQDQVVIDRFKLKEKNYVNLFGIFRMRDKEKEIE